MKVIGIVLMVLVVGTLGTCSQAGWGFERALRPRIWASKRAASSGRSSSPNSVSSQADLYPDHPQRLYAAIAAFDAGPDAQASLKKIEGILDP